MPRLLWALVLAGALLLAGCGVGGSDAPKTVAQPKVTKAQLAAMVLPQAELGELAAGLEPGASGRVDNAQEAENSTDPNDTGKSLRATGRLDGHEAYYAGLVAKKKGLVLVGTEVELLEDSVYAAQYLHQRANDEQRFQGKQEDGSKSVIKSFSPAPVGDEAEGLLGTLSKGKQKLFVTLVAFKRGRVVGSAMVARPNKQDVKDEVWALAVKLDKRIQAVLAGEIEVAQPSPETSTSKKATAAELERLPSQTLAPEDVGPGVMTQDEGPTKGRKYRGYKRSFSVVNVGGSHLLSLQGETQLFDTPSDAATHWGLDSGKAGRLALAQNFIAGFADSAGLKPSNVRVRELPDLGRGLSGMLVTFEHLGTKFTVTVILASSGRLVQSTVAISLRGASTPSDLVPVAQRATKRLDG